MTWVLIAQDEGSSGRSACFARPETPTIYYVLEDDYLHQKLYLQVIEIVEQARGQAAILSIQEYAVLKHVVRQKGLRILGEQVMSMRVTDPQWHQYLQDPTAILTEFVL